MARGGFVATSSFRFALIAAASLVSILGMPPPVRADVKIGGRRPTTLHVPSSYDPQVPAPLLLFLHGCPSDGAGPYGENVLKLGPVAAERGILFVVPDGTGNPGERSWGFCSGSFQENSAYLRSLIEEAQGLFNVDRARIFVAGYSDGGFMSYRMATHHGDLVAAIACLAGANSSQSKPSVPVAVLDIHGTTDANVPYADGVRSIEAFVRDFAWEMPREEMGLGPDIVRGRKTAITRWGVGCLPEGFAELWTLPGIDHFPNLISEGTTTALARHMVDWLLSRPRGPVPVAAMTVVPSNGPAPLEVTADGSASTAPGRAGLRSYCWSFGEGRPAGGVIAAHTYDVPGQHVVRLMVVSNEDRVSTRAEQAVTITCPAGDLGPWMATSIGEGAYPATARFEGDPATGDLLLCTAGTGLLGTKENILFIHRSVEGNFRLTVRISELLADASGGFAGAMCRESLGAASPFVGTILRTTGSPPSQGDNFLFRYRLEEAQTVRGSSAERLASLAGWVRLERRRDTFVNETSRDGVSWSRLGEQVLAGAPTSMLVGIAAARWTAGAADFDALRARVQVELEERPSTFYIRGDSNADGAVDISDAVAVLGFTFLGDPSTLECHKSGDANDDGGLDISDGVTILSHLFLGGQPPPEPFQACGTDPTGDDLSCDSFSPCR